VTTQRAHIEWAGSKTWLLVKEGIHIILDRILLKDPAHLTSKCPLYSRLSRVEKRALVLRYATALVLRTPLERDVLVDTVSMCVFEACEQEAMLETPIDGKRRPRQPFMQRVMGEALEELLGEDADAEDEEVMAALLQNKATEMVITDAIDRMRDVWMSPAVSLFFDRLSEGDKPPPVIHCPEVQRMLGMDYFLPPPPELSARDERALAEAIRADESDAGKETVFAANLKKALRLSRQQRQKSHRLLQQHRAQLQATGPVAAAAAIAAAEAAGVTAREAAEAIFAESETAAEDTTGGAMGGASGVAATAPTVPNQTFLRNSSVGAALRSIRIGSAGTAAAGSVAETAVWSSGDVADHSDDEGGTLPSRGRAGDALHDRARAEQQRARLRRHEQEQLTAEAARAAISAVAGDGDPEWWWTQGWVGRYCRAAGSSVVGLDAEDDDLDSLGGPAPPQASATVSAAHPPVTSTVGAASASVSVAAALLASTGLGASEFMQRALQEGRASLSNNSLLAPSDPSQNPHARVLRVLSEDPLMWVTTWTGMSLEQRSKISRLSAAEVCDVIDSQPLWLSLRGMVGCNLWRDGVWPIISNDGHLTWVRFAKADAERFWYLDGSDALAIVPLFLAWTHTIVSSARQELQAIGDALSDQRTEDVSRGVQTHLENAIAAALLLKIADHALEVAEAARASTLSRKILQEWDEAQAVEQEKERQRQEKERQRREKAAESRRRELEERRKKEEEKRAKEQERLEQESEARRKREEEERKEAERRVMEEERLAREHLRRMREQERKERAQRERSSREPSTSPGRPKDKPKRKPRSPSNGEEAAPSVPLSSSQPRQWKAPTMATTPNAQAPPPPAGAPLNEPSRLTPGPSPPVAAPEVFPLGIGVSMNFGAPPIGGPIGSGSSSPAREPASRFGVTSPSSTFGVATSSSPFGASLLPGHGPSSDVDIGISGGYDSMVGISVGLMGGFTLDDSAPSTSASMVQPSAPSVGDPASFLTLSFLDD
jgi:hypothetical protein